MGADSAGGFGALLRASRVTAGLTQEDLAQRAGLSARTISDLERGTRRPYLRTVSLLAGALSLDEPARARLAAAARASGTGPSAAGQPSAPVPAATGAVPLAHVPRQLPAVTRDFVGREAELAALSQSLASSDSRGGTVVISTVGGIAGVGKTTLALRWAHLVAGQFPDGQLYLDLRGFGPGGPPVTAQAAIQALLEALGVPAARIPADPQARAGLYRSELAGRRMLVVLDNARDSEQVIPLLPGTASCLAVVTSRNPLTGLVVAKGAGQVPLDVLTVPEARTLLALRLGRQRVAAEPAVAEEIVALTGRLPLALTVVAARAAVHPGHSLGVLADGLRDERHRLDALEAGELPADVRAAFSWSYRLLSDPARVMFRLLSLHPAVGVSVAVAASLAAVSRPAARQALAELAAAGLLTEPAAGRFSCHDLVRSYAIELCETGDSAQHQQLARERMASHYLHSAAAARLVLNAKTWPMDLVPLCPGVLPEQFGSAHDAMTWFGVELATLLALLDAAAGAGLDAYVQQLPFVMSLYLDRVGHWAERIEVAQASIAAARRRGDICGQARAHRHLGGALTQVGRVDEALAQLRDALALYGQAGDHEGLGHTHHALAVALSEQEQFGAALEHARAALRTFRLIGNLEGQAWALDAMGYELSRLGQHEQAIRCCQQALALCEQIGDRIRAAVTMDTTGQAYHNYGRVAEAITWYHRALPEWRDLGYRWGECETLTRLGEAHLARGETGPARAAWQQALAILDDLAHPRADEIRAKLDRLGRGEPGAAAGRPVTVP